MTTPLSDEDYSGYIPGARTAVKEGTRLRIPLFYTVKDACKEALQEDREARREKLEARSRAESKRFKQEEKMTQKKVSNERIAEWLDLLRQELIENDGTIITTWINADRSYCYGRTDELDFTDPEWTGPLLEAYAKRVSPTRLDWWTVMSRLLAVVIDKEGIEIEVFNTALIAALEALEKEK